MSKKEIRKLIKDLHSQSVLKPQKEMKLYFYGYLDKDGKIRSAGLEQFNKAMEEELKRLNIQIDDTDQNSISRFI